MIKPGLKDLWQYVSRIFVLSLNELCHSNTTTMEKFFTRLCYKQMRKHQEWLIDEVFIFVFFWLTDRFPCEPKQSPPGCQ